METAPVPTASDRRLEAPSIPGPTLPGLARRGDRPHYKAQSSRVEAGRDQRQTLSANQPCAAVVDAFKPIGFNRKFKPWLFG